MNLFQRVSQRQPHQWWFLFKLFKLLSKEFLLKPKHFPLRVFSLGNNLRKSPIFYGNPLTAQWRQLSAMNYMESVCWCIELQSMKLRWFETSMQISPSNLNHALDVEWGRPGGGDTRVNWKVSDGYLVYWFFISIHFF